jgi:hypothetical protein
MANGPTNDQDDPATIMLVAGLALLYRIDNSISDTLTAQAGSA